MKESDRYTERNGVEDPDIRPPYHKYDFGDGGVVVMGNKVVGVVSSLREKDIRRAREKKNLEHR